MNGLAPPPGWLGPLLRSIAANACFNGAYCWTCGPGAMPRAICEVLGLPGSVWSGAFPDAARALLVVELRSLQGEILDDEMAASFASRLIAQLAGRDGEGRASLRSSLRGSPAGMMLEREIRASEQARARAAEREAERERARVARREAKAKAHAERVAKGPQRLAAWRARKNDEGAGGEGER